MGGKHKQAQRTKNNARPSSSGRSAELLGNQAPKFVGFGAVKDGGYIPVLPGFSLGASDILDPNISADFQIVLKKMNKKDSTTKLKALQEFADLVGNSQEQDMNSVLPFWPRLYCHLAVDAEHRVREAAHQAQLAVVKCMRRNLAPYLRQLIGPWFTSHYDTYSPAASAAKHSFQEAFPPSKVPGVIVFCQNEILNYIYDIVIVQKPQTLGNPQAMTKEEMEAKYERMLVSSLHGYALYLDVLPQDQLNTAIELNKKIVSPKKFWKYSKHPVPLVRSAWFKAVVALCQKMPELLVEESSQVTLAVFNNLDETDPVALSAVWEAALLLLTSLKDCWSHVSVEKLVLPKLWNIVQQGGQGSATTIFPNLLLLLSKIPDSIIKDKMHFFSLFFTNMRQGFAQKSVYQSSSESNAVAKCYMECLQFVIVRHFEKQDFCIDLVQNHLVPAIEFTVRNNNSNVLAEALYHHASLMVCSWDKDEKYCKLRNAFWSAVGTSVLNILRDECLQEPPSWILDRVLLLCCCLDNPSYHRSRQRKHVTFAIEEAPDSEPGSTSQSSPNIHVQVFVQDICKVYLDKMKNEDFSYFLPPLTVLVRKFGNEELLAFLSSLTGDSLTLLEWAKHIISEWLSLDKASLQEVIKFAFNLLEVLPECDQLPLLKYLAQMAKADTLLVWFLQSVTLYHHIPAVSKWLAGGKCCSLLLSLARETLTGPLSNEARNVMADMLKRTPLGEFLLPVEVLEKILRVYYEALSTSWDALPDKSVVSFVCKIVCALYCGDLMVSPGLRSSSTAEALVLLLFDGSCNMHVPYKELHDETIAAWEMAVGALSRTHGACSETFRILVGKFSAVLRQRLLQPMETEDSVVHHFALNVASRLLRCSARDPTGSMDYAALVSLHAFLLDSVTCCVPGWQEQMADLCHYAMGAAGLMHTIDSYPGVVLDEPTDVPNFSRLFSASLFSALLMARLYKPMLKVDSFDGEPISAEDAEHTGYDSDDDFDESLDQEETCSVLLKHIVSILYTSTLGSEFSTHYRATSYANAIWTKLEALSSISREILEALSPSNITDLSADIIYRASIKGGLWLSVINELPLSGPVDLSCFDRLELCSLPRQNAVQIYPRLKESAKSEKLPAFIQEALSGSNVVNSSLSIAATWFTSDGLVTNLDFLKCCIRYVCDHIKEEAQLCVKERDLTALDWKEVHQIVAILNFLHVVLPKIELLSENGEEWLLLLNNLSHDGIVMVLFLIKSLRTARSQLLVPSGGLRVPLCQSSAAQVKLDGNPDDCKVQYLAIVALRVLFAISTEFLKTSPSDASWECLYCKDVCDALSEILQYVTENVNMQTMTCHDQLLLESLVNAVMSFETDFITPTTKSEDSVEYCCKLLTTTVLELQQVGYHMNKSLTQKLVMMDTSLLEEWPAGSEAEVEAALVAKLNIWKLRHVLEHTQGLMEALLSDFSLGDCCLVQPHTDSFAFARAYLFVWELLLAMCGHADSDLRFHYASQLSEQGYVASLLQTLFRLMPEDVIHLKKTKNSDFLHFDPSRTEVAPVGSRLTSETLQDWVCLVYLHALQRLPAVVRQWWSGLDSHASTLVEQVTAQYISPTLCSLEIETLRSKEGSMTVHVYERAREVVAKYHVEEVTLELSVVLPSNHPLGPVKVESMTRQPMVEYANWRNWTMQLTVFLAHQNGSLWDGLNLWKSNLDKKFEGIEECYICFSILHGASFQIPRIRCETCKKKFHSQCMYKWFDTSNKSTCPICRNFIF